MPEDGFDWAAAWGVEFAIGDQHLQDLRKTQRPEGDDKIRTYEECMLAAQAVLRRPPAEARLKVDDLESSHLAQVERISFLSARQSNDARLRISTMREELLRALASK